jgi:phosphatidylglycerophosphate synthase
MHHIILYIVYSINCLWCICLLCIYSLVSYADVLPYAIANDTMRATIMLMLNLFFTIPTTFFILLILFYTLCTCMCMMR